MDELIGLLPEQLTDKQEEAISEAVTTYGEAMQRGGFNEGFRRALIVIAKKLQGAKA